LAAFLGEAALVVVFLAAMARPLSLSKNST